MIILQSGILNNIKYEVGTKNRYELIFKVINYKTNKILESVINKSDIWDIDDEIDRLIIKSII